MNLKKQRLHASMILLVLLFTMNANLRGQEQKDQRLVKEIEVINIEVPVRVLHKGKTVSGLAKEDFTLTVNGKTTPVNGFFEVRKRLGPPAGGAEATASRKPARLFLLIFHLHDYHLDMSKILDTFFDSVFRPKDRLMVITGNTFFDDRPILKPMEEKRKLQKILELETAALHIKQRALERDMERMLMSWQGNRKYKRFNRVGNHDFINNYKVLLRQYNNTTPSLTAEAYLRLARYLKEQGAEKWVLNFYQVGRFLKPRFNSALFTELIGDAGDTAADAGGTLSSLDSFRRYDGMVEDLAGKGELSSDDLSKFFADTGASFHTIQMEYGGNVRGDIAQYLSYSPVHSNAYELLKSTAKKTGGTYLASTKPERFFNKITEHEDTHYVLTYVPEKGDKKSIVRVRIKKYDKKYRVAYDDGNRSRAFRQVVKKTRAFRPPLTVYGLTAAGKELAFIVENFKLAVQGTKLPVRLQVFDKDARSLYNGASMFDLKDLKTARVRLAIQFPKLPKGTYSFFVWVGDPETGKRELAVKEIEIE